MNGAMFWDTMAGQKFTEGTVPMLIEAINRLADAVEKSNEIALKEAADKITSERAGEDEFTTK